MKNIKINDQVLHFPPFISTNWEQVASLHLEKQVLILTMKNGQLVSLPSLELEKIDAIYDAYDRHIEKGKQKPLSPQSDFPRHFPPKQEIPIQFGFGNMENLGAAMQHDPSQMHSPDLPQEILEKIGAIGNILSPEDPDAVPKPEPHCNCVHCQIARAIHGGSSPNKEEAKEPILEEEVTDEELQFQQWDITQTSDQLYTVTNKVNEKEQYSVYLGHPVGCTCGKEGCEHIIAILKS